MSKTSSQFILDSCKDGPRADSFHRRDAQKEINKVIMPTLLFAAKVIVDVKTKSIRIDENAFMLGDHFKRAEQDKFSVESATDTLRNLVTDPVGGCIGSITFDITIDNDGTIEIGEIENNAKLENSLPDSPGNYKITITGPLNSAFSADALNLTLEVKKNIQNHVNERAKHHEKSKKAIERAGREIREGRSPRVGIDSGRDRVERPRMERNLGGMEGFKEAWA